MGGRKLSEAIELRFWTRRLRLITSRHTEIKPLLGLLSECEIRPLPKLILPLIVCLEGIETAVTSWASRSNGEI